MRYTFVRMRSGMETSLARFMMILSMILLGVLEYLWLQNEYENKYRDMEDKLTHVMFSTVRDVEDSLIFSSLPSQFVTLDERQELDMKVTVHCNDSLLTENIYGSGKGLSKHGTVKARHPMRGVLLKELARDSSAFDTPGVTIAGMVMKNLRLRDSTGETSEYQMISWQNGDTMIRGIMSRPQFDVFGGKKIALTNPNYRADLFHDLLPHISFAVFLWIMVGAAFYYIWKNLRQQIQLNMLRDEFVSNITHELKTPITTVGVALESLHFSDEIKSAQGKRYLEICQSELKRLSMLVERILHNRAPQIHYEKMDVRQVLDDVMHHMKVQFDNKNARIEIDHAGEGFVINGDKTHMSGVLYNLLENALKYSPHDPLIRVHLQRNNGSVRIDIADNGIGIDPNFHGKIFEKLYRVPTHNQHDVKGHGLGLSYVADVVKKHNGHIDINSELGKGSTFSIKFPAWHEN
ncbi:MAG: HAMP domain-containing histidine kinase [Bacteroidota bacterium]|nr:HAMP domain-containing histidine kinase [Bacteroidota bacterium]